ncbi:MAG: exodeoxyribonuclease V subunit beta [Magnetococcales bacterium]|nr:exodeoxyribonuclease V subunit beta [Magnetococcales bacterium]
MPMADSPPLRELDPLRFSLRGRHLIEASAGTGKTYTIALLYVRLVLGHGVEGCAMRPLIPPEILVVTFTKAATRELRDRIRVQLSRAAVCFREESEQPEPSLLALRDDFPVEAWPGCARKLQLAAEWMDEAAVETIHGWCNRMLREHAFDSDSLFTQQLEGDSGELLAEVVRDYWRVYLAGLSVDQAREVGDCWSDVETLLSKVRRLLGRVGRLEPAGEPTAIIGEGLAIKQWLLDSKPAWRDWIPELRLLLDRAVAGKSVDGRKLQARYYTPWLQTLEAWALDDRPLFPELSDSAWHRLSSEGLAEAWKSGTPPEHPAVRAMDAMRAARTEGAGRCHRLLTHAVRWIAARFAAEKNSRAVMEFDDVLQRLDGVLSAANGPGLAALLRRQFPVALIDEFQDTDPVQYRIFDRIYPDHSGEEDGTTLVLIGDPKQAIYSFRGADIHTYLVARRIGAERLHTLRKNYRSTMAMVAAVNTLFGEAEARSAGGAFLHRAGKENPIPFVTVAAHGRQERFEVEGEPVSALTFWWTLDSAQAMAAACASEMVRLLNLGQRERAGFVGEGAEWRGVRPSDMAVLVHRRQEYLEMREALAIRGVRCVYLSDKDSVYRTPTAIELHHWLSACAAPDDPGRIRTALATRILGVGWREIDALSRDEGLLEQRIRQFRGYQQGWRRQGVLPMLRRLMHDFRVPERLLRDLADGERILTDLLHLAELMQKNSAALEGELALIRDLERLIQDEQGSAEEESERLMRLESDADLVRIVSVHKSKGLEYPLVFFPFAAHCRPVSGRDLPLSWSDDQGVERLAFDDPRGEVIPRLDRERLQEDLRKLYVAFTRARHATWVGVVWSRGFDKSALRHLLTERSAVTAEEIEPLLTALNRPDGSMRAVAAPEADASCFQPPERQEAIGPARRAHRVVRAGWWIGSYSAINTPAGRGGGESAPESPEEELFRELGRERESEAAGWEGDAEWDEGSVGRAAVGPAVGAVVGVAMGSDAGAESDAGAAWHTFPRGAKAGTFLHDLLAWCALQGFAKVAADPEGLRELVARRCQPRGWAAWIEPVTGWLLRLLSTPLELDPLTGDEADALRLMDLTRYQAEMEFMVAAQRVSTGALDALVRGFTLSGVERVGVADQTLHGMLKGFMDLVFEHRGRYFVLDYKSNQLGPDDRAYSREGMCAEMLHARYELQYVLYLFALHRHLQARLPDYDYDRHMGGAIHWFVRGICSPGQGLFVDRPPRSLFEELDALFRSGNGEESP